jgi:putative ABC transport system permease protein
MRQGRFAFSVALYRLLLVVYPRRFRTRFASEMTADFVEMLEDRTTGRPIRGRLACWRQALADLRASAVHQRLRRWRAPAPPAAPGGDGIMWSFLQDLRFAARSLRKAPGFTLATIATLGLAIGANTAVFSIVDTVVLRPLPFPEADRLVMFFEGIEGANLPKIPASPPDLLDFQQYQESFDVVGAYKNEQVELSGAGEPARMVSARVSASLFPLIGATPILGRTFTADEDRPGNRVVLISHALWQTRLGGSRDVLGRSVSIDRQPHTIVGVMPQAFRFPLPGSIFNTQPADVWVPMAFTDYERQARGEMFSTSVIARLKPGVTIEQARAELRVLASRIQQNYPDALRTGPYRLKLGAVPLRDEIVGMVARPLYVLLAAVALVLLVACANVANLVLSRTAGRARELSVRTALGAGTSRLIRGLLTESLILAGVSAALGVLLAWWALGVAVALAPAGLPVPSLQQIGIDLRALGFTTAVALATAVVFGLTPLMTLRFSRLSEALRETFRATASRRRHRVQGTLVVVTVSLAVVLLTGAGLLIRSFARLMTVDTGFRAANVLTMTLALPPEAYRTAPAIRTFFDQVHRSATHLPGVQAASLSSDLPLASKEHRAFWPEASAVPDTVPVAVAATWTIGDYFETLGIPLRRGRYFTSRDGPDSQLVAIVSESLADRYWPGQDPIGKRLKWGIRASLTPWMTVVGVVANVNEWTLATRPDDHVYQPAAQVSDESVAHPLNTLSHNLSLALLSSGDVTTLTRPMLDEIRRIDPALAVSEIQTMTQLVSGSVSTQRMTMLVLSGFAIAALLLAAIGIYGVLALSVTQRTAEIGVRLALGARPTQVAGLVLRRGAALAAAGLVIGLAAALAVSRVMTALLFETTTRDLLTYAAVPVVLGLVALAACYLPARRASRIDPIVALRVE